MPEREAVIEVYLDAAQEWRWRFRASNGKVLADSAEGYKEKRDLEHALTLLRDAAATAITEALFSDEKKIAGPKEVLPLVAGVKTVKPRPSRKK